MADRTYNFSPGPAMLPLSALEQAQRDLLALPGVALFAWMMKAGLVDASIAENDVRRATEHAGDG